MAKHDRLDLPRIHLSLNANSQKRLERGRAPRCPSYLRCVATEDVTDHNGGTRIVLPPLPIESQMKGSEETTSTDFIADSAALDTEIIWEDVSTRLESFLKAWDECPDRSEPQLVAFLPGPGAVSRPFTLVELIKVDMERRWTDGREVRPISAYGADFPELELDGGMPVDLLYEDIYIRQQHGDSPDVEAYLADYPQQAAEVRRMLQFDKHDESTCLSHHCPNIEVGPGDQIDDFELLSRLGKGAFASVFLARQMSMQRIVAVKISADRGREPQTLARLDHPNIVRVYDQRVLADRGLRLLYMQYVPGGTMQELLKMLKQRHPAGQWDGSALLQAIDARLEEQAVSIPHDSANRRRIATKPWHEVVCHLGQQLAEALHYAHNQGVLHRDIKPANILISDSASPKLVDFNISSCSKVEGASATAYFGGSLAYMSPEQMEACNPRHERTAQTLGAPSDIYALGIVIWELLMGRRPFADEVPQSGWTATLDALTDRRREGIDEASWQQLARKVPPGIVDVLRKCLAPNVDDRLPTAAHLADRLTICLHPRAQQLLAKPTRLIPRAMALWPSLCLVVIMIVPNAVAGWLNYRFNYETMIQPLAGSDGIFLRIVMAINGVAFPLGMAVGLWMVRKEAREVARRTRFDVEDPAPLEMRHRCLRLGRYLAILGMTLWAIAGLIYPMAMWMSGHPLQGNDSFHFFTSLLACGAIGASYPFFGATAMFVEVWYPALVRPRSVGTEDIPAFQWVERIGARYLVMAGAVPLFSLAVLTLRGEIEHPHLLAGVAIGGLVVFAMVFQLWRRLHQDFDVLEELAKAKD
jgi:serine/threonine protein kinase